MRAIKTIYINKKNAGVHYQGDNKYLLVINNELSTLQREFESLESLALHLNNGPLRDLWIYTYL